MKKFLQILSVALISILGGSFYTVQAQATTYYWMGGSGNWFDASHWSTTNGTYTNGDPANNIPAKTPSINDNVVFNENSLDPTAGSAYEVTINTDAACADMTWTEVAGITPTLSGTSKLTVKGALTFVPSLIINFTGSIVFTSDNPVNPITTAGKVFLGPIEFDGNGAWQLQDNMGVTKDISFNKGVVQANNTTIRSSGNWIINDPGKFESGTGSVILEGSDDREIRITPANSNPFNNLEISKTGSNVLMKSPVQVKQNLTISSGTLRDEGFQINSGLTGAGSIMVANGASLVLGDDNESNGATTFPSFSSRTLADNSTVNYRDRATPQPVLNTTYGNLKFSNSINGASPQRVKSLIGSITVNGNLTVDSDINLVDNGFQIIGKNDKTFTLSGNSTLTLGSTSVETRFPINFTSTNINLSINSTVVYNAGVALPRVQTIAGLNGAGNTSYGNVRLAGNSTKILGDNINIRGNLTIDAGSTLDASTNGSNAQSRNINIQGNWTSAGSFIARNGTVLFNGTVNQNISTTTPNNEFFNVVINKPSGDILLNSDVSIGEVLNNNNPANNGNITFTKGLVKRPANSNHTLTINNNTTSSGASQDSYVVGAVKKKGDDAFSFPIGNEPTATQPNSYYRPLNVTTNNNVNTEYLVQYYNTPAAQNVPPAVSTTKDDKGQFRDINKVRTSANGALQGLNGAVSRYEYWTLDNILDINGSRNTNVSIPFNTATSGPPGYLGDPAGLVLAGWTRDNYWENRGGANQKGTPNAVSPDGTSGRIFGSEALSARMNVFTIGTIFNALPIELMYFRAQAIGDAVQFHWATVSEKDNAYFTIEKSSDAVNFNELSRIAGAGNSQELIKYTATDAAPFTPVSYYRLKQTDTDGKFTYSKIVSVESNAQDNFLQATLTGEKQLEINCGFGDTAEAMLTIYDSRGAVVWTKKVAAGKQQAVLPTAASGLYMITLQTASTAMVKKVFIR